MNGILTISFNKPILEPPIHKQRKLESGLSGFYDIKEVLGVSIIDMEDDAKAAQLKAICSMYFKSLIDNRKLQIALEFCRPTAITTDITEPDLLEIEILKPLLFVDVERREPIEAVLKAEIIDIGP